MVRNAELEAALVANPEDRDTYRVYADWLLAHADPRGELMALQLRIEDEPDNASLPPLVTELLKRAEPELLGALAPRLASKKRYGHYRPPVVWQRGFITDLTLATAFNREAFTPLLSALLDHPSLLVLRSLWLDGRLDYGQSRSNGDTDHVDVIALLARVAPPVLRVLTIEFSCVPNLAELAALPGLEVLRIHGEYGVEVGITGEVMRAIANAPWPRLRSLTLELARDGANPSDLAQLLARRDLPLTELVVRGDRRAAFGSELCRLLVASPMVDTLEHIALWVGNLSRADYELLETHRDRFRVLGRFDLPSTSATEKLSVEES